MRAVYKLLIACLTAIAFSGCMHPGETSRQINIIVASDLHYLDPSLASGPSFDLLLNDSDGRLTAYINEIMDAFIQRCIEEKPDAVILSGDLTFNGERFSHETLARMLDRLIDADIQPLVIPGNHDINNPGARDYSAGDPIHTDTITADQFSEIYSRCGYQQALYQDPSSLNYVYAVSPHCWILMLDTCQYDHNYFAADATGRIREDQFNWIESILIKAKEKNVRVISVTHHMLTALSMGDSYRIVNADEILNLYAKYNVKVNLGGHIHAQCIQSEETDGNSLTEIITSSLSVYNHHFGVIEIDPDAAVTYHAESVDLQKYAEMTGNTDPFLQNYNMTGKQYFISHSLLRISSYLDAAGLDNETKNRLLDLLGEENVCVFTGRSPDYIEIYKNSGLDSIIQTLPPSIRNLFTYAQVDFPDQATDVSVSLN